MRAWKIYSLFFFLLTALHTAAQDLQISPAGQSNAFPLFEKGKELQFCTDPADATVVQLAATAFAGDYTLLTGSSLLQVQGTAVTKDYAIIAGTVGHSSLIDELTRTGLIRTDSLKGQWERFSISVINKPFQQAKKLLVIAGSDRRGTAFGIFHLSRMLGVSPWVWWADVVPAKKQQLWLSGTYTSKTPSVKYRGIFINDEDWGLFPWAKRNLDKEVQNIGPKTYAKVFELLLRLKANYLWPAMHDSTKAFYYFKESPKLADDYAIAIGGSHCEPMLRNNVCEWEQTFEEEYKKKPGEWRYDVNKEEIFNYWNDRIKEAVNYESVVTIGMRGVHDGGMPGPKDPDQKLKLLENIIADQRGILEQHFKKPADQLPQIFVPYKEVLALYRRGMKLPDDITIIWPDENFGYIRQLPTPEEQRRSGRSGIYYHLSYLGGPHDHTWLSTTSPALISYEMTKAYQFGADRLWVVNVGDIKPAEMELQFFLDLGYDIQAWTPEIAHQYSTYWAAQQFGKTLAPGIAAIKNEYYRLAQEGKPEFMRMLTYLPSAREKRLNDYLALYKKTETIKKNIPAHLRSAFFELIEYPVKGASLINQKIIYAQKSFEDSVHAAAFSKSSFNAFEEIKALTLQYNSGIENGKWNGMMDYKPRNLAVFGMPDVAVPETGTNIRTVYDRRYLDRTIDSFGVLADIPSKLIVAATAFTKKKEIAGEKLITVNGLGRGGNSISRYPFTGKSFKTEEYPDAPYAEYSLTAKAGNYQLVLKCLPTHAIHKGRSLGIMVTVNDGDKYWLDINNPEENKTWKTDILRGFSEAVIPVAVKGNEKLKIRIYLMDTGLALSSVELR